MAPFHKQIWTLYHKNIFRKLFIQQMNFPVQ